MRARLRIPPHPGFSKTARSRPRLHEARRDRAEVRCAPAIHGRRLAHDLGEGPAERAQAREADVEADLGHAAVRLPQQEHRALNAATLQVAMWRLAEGGAEDTNEVRFGYIGDPRQRSDVERLRVVAIHRVT